MELNDDILVQTTSLHFIAFHASQSSSQKESKYILFRLNKLETRSTAVHVPPKRNIFSKTIVDIGSAHMGVPHECSSYR